MKAKHYKIMRIFANDKDWLEEQLWNLAEVFRQLNHFKDFECSTFFRGHLLAELNREQYDKKNHKARHKEIQLKRLIERLET